MKVATFAPPLEETQQPDKKGTDAAKKNWILLSILLVVTVGIIIVPTIGVAGYFGVNAVTKSWEDKKTETLSQKQAQDAQNFLQEAEVRNAAERKRIDDTAKQKYDQDTMLFKGR